jgi:hypothetical protein
MCGHSAYSDRQVRELRPGYDGVSCYDVTRGPGRRMPDTDDCDFDGHDEEADSHA